MTLHLRSPLEGSFKTNGREENPSYPGTAGARPWSQGRAGRRESSSIPREADSRRPAYTWLTATEPSFLASVVQNFQFAPLSLWSATIYIIPMTSYHPLPKNQIDLLAVEAKRQSLCIDVIFQGNNS